MNSRVQRVRSRNRLPVVSRENSRLVVGCEGRASVMTARLHRMKEERRLRGNLPPGSIVADKTGSGD